MMPPDGLETLRQGNEQLRSALLRLRPERAHCAAIQPQEISGLIRQFAQAAERLGRLAGQSDDAAQAAAFEEEKSEFYRNLETLKRFLPDLHVRLLAEKSRLEAARHNLEAAASWAQARIRTL
jgi:hypothetical protein